MPTLDEAWKGLFAEHDLARSLARDDVVYLTADEVRRSGVEPRLMTKFDFPNTRPTTLRNAKVTILPVSNGRYALIRGDGYQPVPKVTGVAHRIPADALERLTTLTLPPSSESQAIDAAWACGILEHFVGEPISQTIRGRLRSPAFDFRFQASRSLLDLSVEGVQVEVDGGFEGRRSVYLVEAKLGAADAFILRQLYYPYRFWCERLAGSKPVVPIFLDYSNGEFLLVAYDFQPPDAYHGVRAVRAARYELDVSRPVPTLTALIAEARESVVPAGVPFPQADRLERVADMVDAVAGGATTAPELAERWGFDVRQSAYYSAAAEYLGLLERGQSGWRPTVSGRRFMALRGRDDRRVALTREILARPALLDAARVAVRHTAPEELTAALFDGVVKHHTDLSGETVRRRAQTLAAWMRTLLEWFPQK